MPTLEELKTIINQLREDLSKAHDTMRQFDGAVSELNNLLGVMRGNAQLVEDDQTEEAKDELVRVVLASTARAHEIIEDQLKAKVIPDSQVSATEAGATPAPADILIVDDDKTMCSMMARILDQDSHTITQASTGKEAIDFCQKQTFDIVLLDIRLIDMSGIDVCRKLQALPVKPCVVFFSGDPSIEDPSQLMREEGAVGFIRKPFEIQEIRNVVRLILNQRIRP